MKVIRFEDAANHCELKEKT